MGEYEPDDSRNVTLSDHQAPGEPERTGPREDKARRQAEAENDEMAIDNPAGDPRPEYNQYNLNDPESIDKRDADAVEEADRDD